MVMVEELNKSKRKGNMDKGLKLSVGKYKPMGGGVRGSKKDKKKPNLRRSHLGATIVLFILQLFSFGLATHH
jgi:hypothetical protein